VLDSSFETGETWNRSLDTIKYQAFGSCCIPSPLRRSAFSSPAKAIIIQSALRSTRIIMQAETDVWVVNASGQLQI